MSGKTWKNALFSNKNLVDYIRQKSYVVLDSLKWQIIKKKIRIYI